MDGTTFKTELTKSVRQLRPLLDALLDFIYPPFCLVCRKRGLSAETPVCYNCWSALPRIDPREGPTNIELSGAASPIAAIATVWEFCDEIQTIIHEFKYSKMKSLAVPLGQAMAVLAREWPEFRDADVLVPVPLHNTKLRERGFNQSLLLAGKMSAELGVPVAPGAVSRIRYTRSQSQLNAQQREKNVIGAFQLIDKSPIVGKRVLLVDDVFTTGATLSACAVSLAEAQPEKILALTAANAL